MVTAGLKARNPLVLEPRVLHIGAPGLGLTANSPVHGPVGIRFVEHVPEPPPILPIVSVIVHGAEAERRDVGEPVVQRGRNRPPEPLHVVAPDIHLFDKGASTRALVPRRFDVVGPEMVVEAGCRDHVAQPAAGRTIGIDETAQCHGVTGERVVAASQGSREAAPRRVLSGHDVDRGSDGVRVHVGRDRLVHLDRLHHVGRDQVELDLAHLALGRGNPLAIEGDRVEPGLRPPDQPEPGLTLVHLDRDSGDPLERISDVRVREPPDLVRRNNVRDVRGIPLLLQGTGLTISRTHHRNPFQRDGL